MEDFERQELLKEITEREDQIADLQEELARLSTTIGVLATGFARQQSEDLEHYRTIRNLERDLGDPEDLRYELESCQSELQDAQIQISDLQDEIEALEKKPAKKNRR